MMLWIAIWKKYTPHQVPWQLMSAWYHSSAVHHWNSICWWSQSGKDEKFGVWLTWELNLLAVWHMFRSLRHVGRLSVSSWWEHGAESVWFIYIQSHRLNVFNSFCTLYHIMMIMMKLAVLPWVRLEQVGRSCRIFTREMISWQHLLYFLMDLVMWTVLSCGTATTVVSVTNYCSGLFLLGR
jgi:hypothetical protein